MRRKFFALTAIVMALAVIRARTPALCRETISLKPGFSKGKTSRYLLDMEIITDSRITGLPQTAGVTGVMRMSVNAEVAFTQTVTEVTGNEVQLKITYDSVKMKMAMPGMISLEFDSRNPGDKEKASDPAYAVFAGIAGRSIELVLTPEGKVKQIKGMDEIVEAALSTIPARYRDRTRAQMEQFTRGVEQQLSRSYDFVPPKPVSKGQKWSQSAIIAVPMLGEVQSRINYQYMENRKMPVRECAFILATTINTLQNTAGQVLPHGSRITDARFPSSDSSICFDAVRGEVVKLESSMNMSVDFVFDHPADTALENAGMTQDITLKTSLSLIE